MHFPSDWEPKEWDIPNDALNRLAQFNAGVHRQLKIRRPNTPNLLPYQLLTIAEMNNHNDILVVNCDKKVGPAVIDTSTYVSRAFSDHLDTSSVYKELTEDAAHTHMTNVYQLVQR